MNNTNLRKFIRLIHNKIIKIDDFYLMGYSGEPLKNFEKDNPKGIDILGFPIWWSSKNVHAFGEKEIYENLLNNARRLNPKKVILITHSPPHRILDKINDKFIDWAVKSYGESVRDGHIGSTGLKKFDNKFKPLMHIFGHIHEARGIVRNETFFINTGSVDEYSEVVEIEIKNNKINAKFIKI